METWGFESHEVGTNNRFSLLKGGGPKPYKSQNVKEYDDAAKGGVFNRAGVQRIRNPAYDQWKNRQSNKYGNITPESAANAWKGSQGNYPTNVESAMRGYAAKTGQYSDPGPAPEEYINDYSQVGKRVGKDEATQGYDFNPINEAVQGFRKPTLFKESYNPSQFNFQSLPEEYFNTAYGAGSKSIINRGSDALEKTRESIGVRRPGLLLKAAQGNERDVSSHLADLRGKLELERMREGVQLGKEQQIQQAGENYRGYQSRSDLEKSNADEAYRYLQGLLGAGKDKIGIESDLTQRERDYQDKGLDYILDLFKTGAGLQNNAAAQASQNRNSTLGFLGSAAKVASLFCLPKGTPIETEDGWKVVEEVGVGEKVKGGRVIATQMLKRSSSHKFYRHIFETGEVVMSYGHPYFDSLKSAEPVENDSEHTYDILTDSGHYFVNGVKLGSTIPR